MFSLLSFKCERVTNLLKNVQKKLCDFGGDIKTSFYFLTICGLQIIYGRKLSLWPIAFCHSEDVIEWTDLKQTAQTMDYGQWIITMYCTTQLCFVNHGNYI